MQTKLGVYSCSFYEIASKVACTKKKTLMASNIANCRLKYLRIPLDNPQVNYVFLSVQAISNFSKTNSAFSSFVFHFKMFSGPTTYIYLWVLTSIGWILSSRKKSYPKSILINYCDIFLPFFAWFKNEIVNNERVFFYKRTTISNLFHK